MKWVPVVFWPILPGRAKQWGLLWLAVSVGLSVLTLPLTIIQMQAWFVDPAAVGGLSATNGLRARIP